MWPWETLDFVLLDNPYLCQFTWNCWRVFSSFLHLNVSDSHVHQHGKRLNAILKIFSSPLLRANCFRSLYVFSSSAGHLETHRAMELIFLLMKSMLQGSRKKTYLERRGTLHIRLIGCLFITLKHILPWDTASVSGQAETVSVLAK